MKNGKNVSHFYYVMGIFFGTVLALFISITNQQSKGDHMQAKNINSFDFTTIMSTVSWCETGKSASGQKTTDCGVCIYCHPDKCDAVNDQAEGMVAAGTADFDGDDNFYVK